jgi:hypothetical protein
VLVALSLAFAGSPALSARSDDPTPPSRIRFTQLPKRNLLRTAADVTETRYPNLSVLANWSDSAVCSTDGFGVAPTGFLARSGDGAVVAGTVQNGRFVFTCGGPRPEVPAPTYRITSG